MRKQFAAFVLILGMLLPAIGNAQSTYSSSGNDAFGRTKVYLGVKYGLLTVEPNVDGADDIEIDNMGVVFGGHINDYLAIELDYTQTVSAAKEDFAGSTVKFETDSLGLYLVARTTGQLYGRARVGYSRIEQDVTGFGSDTVYGLSYSLGGGFEFTDNVSLEIEYTLLPETDEFDDLGRIIDDTLDTDIITIGIIWAYE